MKEDCGNKLDDGLREALSEAVFSGKESSFSDRDAFQNWLAEGKERQFITRRRKIRRAALTAAAVFLCVFFLSGSLLVLTDTLPPSLQALLGPEEGVAVPDNEQNVTYENGSIVIGGDGNGNVGTWTATFTSYDNLPEKYKEQIIWFEDMPDGYELEKVEIRKHADNLDFISLFEKDDDVEIIIKQTINAEDSHGGTIFNQFDECVQTENYTIYIKNTKDSKTYSYETSEGIVHIIDLTKQSKEKIETMIVSTKTGWNMK